MSKLIEEIRFNDIEFLMFVLDELADNLARGGKDIIKLTLGKAQEPLHPDIIDKYIKAIKNPDKRNLVYPEGLPELRQKIAEWYTELGNKTSAKSVLINTGTSPFFKDIFRLLAEEGDEVLIPQPYYSVYYVCALLARARVKYYRVNPETMRIDMKDFKKQYDPNKTKFVVTCSPGNPYGNIMTEKEYRQILGAVSEYTYVVADEIYRNTGFQGRVPSILDVATDRQKKKIIITNAFSKGFRMYTARVGFSILPDKLLKPYRVLLQHTLLTTNPAEQFACIEALNHLDEVEKLTEIYKEHNAYAVKHLDGIGGVKIFPAQGGFYLVARCGKFMEKQGINNSFDLSKDILESTGVAIVPGSDFGLSDGIRISFSHLRFHEGIDRLVKYFLKT
jgi:aspartate aminotransferase